MLCLADMVYKKKKVSDFLFVLIQLALDKMTCLDCISTRGTGVNDYYAEKASWKCFAAKSPMSRFYATN